MRNVIRRVTGVVVLWLVIAVPPLACDDAAPSIVPPPATDTPSAEPTRAPTATPTAPPVATTTAVPTATSDAPLASISSGGYHACKLDEEGAVQLLVGLSAGFPRPIGVAAGGRNLQLDK